jgi:hypothetical protein
MEFTLPEFPRCLAYLKKMRCRFEDSNWNNWWAAVLLADSWSDEQLGDAGVSFETMQGSELLAIMEDLLRRGVKREVVKGEGTILSIFLPRWWPSLAAVGSSHRGCSPKKTTGQPPRFCGLGSSRSQKME